MKKIVYGILAAVIVVCGCNTNPGETPPGPPKEKSIDTTILGTQSFSAYKTIGIRSMFFDEKLDSLQLYRELEPKDPKEFVDDSTYFDNEFLRTKEFVMSDSFPISLYTLYSNMQTPLGITERSEYDDFGTETVNGIRVFPALATNADGKKILYMVLLGEESREGAIFDSYDMFTMLNKNYYEVKNGQFTAITSDTDKLQARNNIAAYRTYWNEKFPQNPVVVPDSNANVKKSYGFSIARYYRILSTAHLNIYKGLTVRGLNYGVVFYPCLTKDKKLYFVLKGYQLSGSGSGVQLNPFNHKPFYDNMDVCPDKCPVDDIQ